MIQVGAIYKHSKTGNLYKVLGIGKHTETMEDLVFYEAQYDNPKSKLWARPVAMWEEEIEINGEKLPRFQLK